MKKTLCSVLASVVLTLSCKTARSYDVTDNNFMKSTRDNIVSSVSRVNVGEEIGKDDLGIIHYNRTMGSGVVLCDKATGFRFALTADHLFPKKYNAIYYTLVGERSDVKAIKRDPENDLALVYLKNKEGVCFSGKIGTEYVPGDFVIEAGYMDTDRLHLKRGMVSSTSEDLLTIDGHISFGDSGGPVIAFDWGEARMIGITTLKDSRKEGVSYAVPASKICKFLKDSMVYDDYCKEGEK